MSKKSLAVVLVSGGMDSCVTTAIANLSHELAFLHVNYGQRTEKRELKAFNDIADHYRVKHRLVTDISHLSQIGGSSLTDTRIELPEADPKRLFDRKAYEIPSSYVPFRNANLLCIAVSWAEVIGAKYVYIGTVEEDSSGYPDCRKSFFKAFEKAIKSGTKPQTRISVITPVIKMSKAQIVKKGIELKAPLELTWSCYRNEDIACGTCDSCVLRLRAFQVSGIKDPINYIEKPKYI